MSPLDLLFANSSSHQLKTRTDDRLACILRSNYRTHFAQSATELRAFRDAIAGIMDDIDDAALCETFRKMVQLTTYDAYSPFVSKFLKTSCRESEVVDLLAPGLPDYITRSSSTSGGTPKAFLRYNCLPKFDGSGVGFSDSPKRTTAFLFSFTCKPLGITDENGCPIKTVTTFITSSSLVWRSVFGLPPETDEEKMATFLSDFAAPYAAGFVKHWSAFLIIHGLFALGSRSLERMNMSFVTTFVELIRHIDTQFDMILDCISNGTIPDLDGTAHVRHHLQPCISPDPKRAAELRSIGPPSSRPGWCSLAWPNLSSVTCTASGAFASSLPLARLILGPNVDILARGYASSEARIGLPYSPLNLEHYKLRDETHIEFLDFNESESVSAIVQPWDVDVGKRYEVVITNSHGLWRYRLGDVVEVAGFDPNDGTPIIKFIERRSIAFRFLDVMISEGDLTSAVTSVTESTLGAVVEWTTMPDENRLARSICFFVELVNEPVVDASLVGERILDALSQSNEKIPLSYAKGTFGEPTVRIVERGTFSAFRQLRLDEGSSNIGQVKVPVVLTSPAHVNWFLGRVVKKL